MSSQESQKGSKSNLIPSLNLALIEKSEKLVKEAHLSAKESCRSRRTIPTSARIFNNMKLSTLSHVEIDSVRARRSSTMRSSLSSISNRKLRKPLSSRLPPKKVHSVGSKKLNDETLNVTRQRFNHNLLERRRSSLRGYYNNGKQQTYDVILSKLDCERMEELKDAFTIKNHELEFEEFVHVVWKFMNVRDGEEALVICALLQLFEDIDINDDKKMQWSEFSDFLAESQRHSSDQEADLEKYEVDNFKKPFKVRGGTQIQQLKYSKHYDLIAILMVNSKQITIFNHEKTEIVNTIKGHRNYIISCAFLDGFHGVQFASNIINDSNDSNKQIIVATSGLDEFINIWLVTSKKKPIRLRQVSVNVVHNILYWSNKRKILVSADMNYNLNIWDSKLQTIIWQQNYHSNMIIDILLPNKTSLLLSASLDKTVVCFDLSSDRIKFTLNTHKRGLISMAYKSSLHMLVTAAAEHNLRVSDGNMGRPLGQLIGHSAPVIAMMSIPESPSVVSLDYSNTFKLWDIRKLECIQSILLTNEITAMVSLLPNHAKIALGSGGMHYLNRKMPVAKSADGNSTNVRINLMENENICGIFILETKTQILTIHETMMKKWDLANGEMVKLIRLLPGILSKSHTIMCCSVSTTKKLLLIGSSSGFVAIISIYSGGVVMRCSPKHLSSVIFVAFYKTMIISFDCKGSMFKYGGFKYWMPNKSHDALSRSKLVQFPIHSQEISDNDDHYQFNEYTAGIIHNKFGILIVGTESGLLRFICLINDKIILDVDTLKDGVTSIILKEVHRKIFTTDKSGNICCFQLPKQYPSRKKFIVTCLYTIKNYDDFNIPITTFCVNTIGKYLITGDAKGMMKIWCIEEKETKMKEKCLFLTEYPDSDKHYQCKLMKKITVASDWVNQIFIVTENVLNIKNVNDDNNDDDNDNVLCIISASLDGKLFAWKLNGNCIGELIFMKKPCINWCVKVDLDKKTNQQLQYAFQLFQKMKL